MANVAGEHHKMRKIRVLSFQKKGRVIHIAISFFLYSAVLYTFAEFIIRNNKLQRSMPVPTKEPTGHALTR